MGRDLHKNALRRAGLVARKMWLPLLVSIALYPAKGEITASFDRPLQALELVPGTSVEKELPADEADDYVFELSERSFLRVDFYSPNNDLLVFVSAPGVTEPLEWHVIRRGTAPIAHILDTPGACRLKVRKLGKNANPGVYRMMVTEFHAAGARDLKQAAASVHLSNAARFRLQWTEAALRSAIREYEEALRIWNDIGDQEQEAITLKHMADVWETFAEWDTALSIYERALDAYRRLDDPSGETEVVNAIGVLCINRGEYKKALDAYSPENRATEDPWQKALISRNLGAAAWGMTELLKAREFLNQALEMQKQLHDRAAQADTLLYLGYADFSVKNLSAAERNFQKSLDLFKVAENPRGAALALHAMGLYSSISGEKQDALDYYDQSLEIFETIGELSGRYMVLTGKAIVYLDLGKNDKALQNFQNALDLVKQAGDLALEADILHHLGAIYRDLGDYPRSIECSQRAVEINRSLPSPQAEAYALLNLANTEEVLGKQEEAMQSCTLGLELAQKAYDQFLIGHFLNAFGRLYQRSGQLQKALGYYRQALALQQEASDSVNIPGTLDNLARAESDAGNLEQARLYAEQGLGITESLRSKVASPDLRGSFLASVHQRYELMIDLLMHPGGNRPLEPLDAEAIRISEQARARSLLDMLAEIQVDIREGVDPELLERERSLQKELNSKAAMKMQLLKGKHSKEEEDFLIAEIDLIDGEYQGVRDQIRRNSPHYADLTQPRTLDLRGIQQLIDEGTVLLEYELGEEWSYLWAVTPTSLESHILPERAEIETRAKNALRLLLERQNQVNETNEQYQERIRKADEEYLKEATELGRILLGPVADRLGSKRLLVVAEGVLHHLPFAALPEPEMAGDPSGEPSYLIKNHEIVNLPSASILEILRQETGGRSLPPKKVVVFGDPVFEADDPRIEAAVSSDGEPVSVRLESGIDPATAPEYTARKRGGEFFRLPGTRNEADSIMELVSEGSGRELLGFEANRAAAMGPELMQYQIVHFGTHGFVDNDNPELSGLVLSLFDEQGRSQNGYLRLHDIYNMKLPAELVVLSACDSAQGQEVRGEGLVGLVRGFMYAGSKRIMASLWRVDDRPTAELMKRFYRHLLQEKATPAQALRMAQREMLAQQRRQAPYYWAAFILQGEYR